MNWYSIEPNDCFDLLLHTAYTILLGPSKITFVTTCLTVASVCRGNLTTQDARSQHNRIARECYVFCYVALL